jgi:hypothetical protein
VTKSRGILAPRRPWTEADLQLLRERFPSTQTRLVAAALGRTESMVNGKAYQLGLGKTDEYLSSPAAGRLDGARGASSRFVKGQKSWNKGKKLPGHGNPDTFFKPGTLSGRAALIVAPVGSYRINGDGYLDQKISDEPGQHHRRWKAVHRLVWEAAHGPIPPGHAIAFLPGRRTTDPALITLDALELVTQQELMRRNTYHQYGPEISGLVQLRGAITRQINKRAKEQA